MRTLLLCLALTASGCFGVSDYERVRGQLDATREENARLRDENEALHHDLARATGKLEMIDSILHAEVTVGDGAGRPAPGK
jgi:cell division protein FtsB